MNLMSKAVHAVQFVKLRTHIVIFLLKSEMLARKLDKVNSTCLSTYVSPPTKRQQIPNCYCYDYHSVGLNRKLKSRASIFFRLRQIYI